MKSTMRVAALVALQGGTYCSHKSLVGSRQGPMQVSQTPGDIERRWGGSRPGADDKEDRVCRMRQRDEFLMTRLAIRTGIVSSYREIIECKSVFSFCW